MSFVGTPAYSICHPFFWVSETGFSGAILRIFALAAIWVLGFFE